MKPLGKYVRESAEMLRKGMTLSEVVPPVDGYSLDEAAEEAATKVNCRVVIPSDNQLQLDIDTEEAYNLFLRRVTEFQDISSLHILVEDTPSKSGLPKRHITLTLFNNADEPYIVSEWQRIALQIILGSDLIRETLNAWRLLRGEENPSRLFEPLEETPANAPPPPPPAR